MFGWALLVASPVLTLGATLHVTGETARIIFNEAEPWAEGGGDWTDGMERDESRDDLSVMTSL